MTSEPCVRAWGAAGLGDALRRTGISPERILREVGLRPDILDIPENRIPQREFNKVLELAAKLSEDDGFGLRLGAKLNPNDCGLVGQVALNSPTVEVAFGNITRYCRMSIEAFEATLHTVGESSQFSIQFTDPRIPRSRQQVERIISWIVQFLRLVTEPSWQPLEVHFRHRMPHDVSNYHRIFVAPVLFSQDNDGIKVSRDLLDRPIKSANSSLLRILERYAEDVIAALPADDDFVALLRRNIANELRNGNLNIEKAAKDLGMSSRTLRRRLEPAGLTYIGVVNELRYELSRKYLEDPNLSIKEIGFLLGYSDASAFNRAYKRWSGTPPIAYRQAAFHNKHSSSTPILDN